jgi:hypothetical protein
MDQQQWTAIDKYISDMLVGSDAALDEAICCASPRPMELGLTSRRLESPTGPRWHSIRFS